MNSSMDTKASFANPALSAGLVKICTSCGIQKSLEEFYTYKSGPRIGKSLHYCKMCGANVRKDPEYKLKRKKFRAENKEHLADYRRKYWLACKQKEKENGKKYQSANQETLRFKAAQYRLNNADKLKEKDQAYYEANRQKISERHKRYYALNQPRLLKHSKDYRARNKDKVTNYNRIYRAKRCEVDPVFKCKCAIRSLISNSIKKQSYCKKTKTEAILKCSMLDFKNYIESKFTKGMSWDNYGEWHIDHTVPIASANSEAEVLSLNHYTNLQPLWATSKIAEKYGETNYVGNLEKGAKHSSLSSASEPSTLPSVFPS